MTIAMEHTIQVYMELPEEIDEGDEFEGKIYFRNISEKIFPGINTGVNLRYAMIPGPFSIYTPTDIPLIQPQEEKEFLVSDTAICSGLAYFVLRLDRHGFTALDKNIVNYYLRDGRKITDGQLIGSSRVISREAHLQRELVEALEKSSVSQDRQAVAQERLAIIEVILAFIAAILALIQVWNPIVQFISNLLS